MTDQDVIALIKQYNLQQGGTQSGFTVPRHQHNGSDALKVLMRDLAPDIRGLRFAAKNGLINLNSNGQESLVAAINNTYQTLILKSTVSSTEWNFEGTQGSVGYNSASGAFILGEEIVDLTTGAKGILDIKNASSLTLNVLNGSVS